MPSAPQHRPSDHRKNEVACAPEAPPETAQNLRLGSSFEAADNCSRTGGFPLAMGSNALRKLGQLPNTNSIRDPRRNQVRRGSCDRDHSRPRASEFVRYTPL